MKAAQINGYSKQIAVSVVDVPIPKINTHEVLVKVKAAAVNPLELLITTGSVKLISGYKMPLIIGNEVSGVIEEVGAKVQNFKVGDAVYARLPIAKIGGLAEYVAIDASALWYLPKNLDFKTGAAVPLTGLTAYQGLHEILNAQPGDSVFIPGGSGSFGQLAIPIAKAMGLKVMVSGNAASRDNILELGADRYLDYKKDNYWELLHDLDYVIDTLGPNEFDRELAVLKKGGQLLSLRDGPNQQFAIDNEFPTWKKWLFKVAGQKFDQQAKRKGISYRFIFVRADGKQLAEISKLVEVQNLMPRIDSTPFRIEDINAALTLVRDGHPKGKVLIDFSEPIKPNDN